MTSDREATSGDSIRDMRLLEGRRVNLKDLMDAGLLGAGSNLVFGRPRLGEEHVAVVTGTGRIRLSDGREFASPSRAAGEAADIPSIDGWKAWLVRVTGRSLFDLRHQLLIDSPQGEDGSPQAWLAEAYNAAEAGAPLSVSGRVLLDRWGVKGRGHRIMDQIAADLDNYSLMARPDLRKVSLDTTVELVAQPTAIDETGSSSNETSRATNDLEVGITLGRVPSASAGVTFVNPSDSLARAMTLMRLNDFSQLAVLSSSRNLRGAVTWRSIAKALAHDGKAKLTDAIEPAYDRPYDQDLVDTLGVLYDHDFVFVREANGEVNGIVTTSDVVKLYGETATPFFIIGEIEHLLRRAVADYWTIEQVTEACDPEAERSIKSHDDLAFGDYQLMLGARVRFEVLGWPLDRGEFIDALDRVRQIRNGVAHFDPEPLDGDGVALLRSFLLLLRDLQNWADR